MLIDFVVCLGEFFNFFAELFSHSALVFLLGFAARIVVLVVCMYTFFLGGFGLY
jgi:hypothetical protein